MKQKMMIWDKEINQAIGYNLELTQMLGTAYKHIKIIIDCTLCIQHNKQEKKGRSWGMQ